MKMKTVMLSLFITTSIIQSMFPQEFISKKKPFDYFKQIPPKDTARLFAPGIISDTVKKAWAFAISPNGDEVFFSRAVWPNTKIMYMRNIENKWSLPDTASFSKDCWATEPSFSPDGQYLYFSTSKGKNDIKYYCLWRTKKIKDGWSRPESLFDIGGDSIWEFHPTISSDGSLYFCYWDSQNQTGDIYMSRCTAIKCSDPIRIGYPISNDYSDINPFVSPDGGYMIIASNRPDGYGDYDRYISFRNNNGTWTSLRNLGPKFNTRASDSDIDISPDGKFMFVYVNGNIYWTPVGDIINR
jgi:Tol biopolymer transport system component